MRHVLVEAERNIKSVVADNMKNVYFLCVVFTRPCINDYNNSSGSFLVI